MGDRVDGGLIFGLLRARAYRHGHGRCRDENESMLHDNPPDVLLEIQASAINNV